MAERLLVEGEDLAAEDVLPVGGGADAADRGARGPGSADRACAETRVSPDPGSAPRTSSAVRTSPSVVSTGAQRRQARVAPSGPLGRSTVAALPGRRPNGCGWSPVVSSSGQAEVLVAEVEDADRVAAAPAHGPPRPPT